MIPLTIAARNEERALGPCLDSYLRAIAVAEQRLDIRIDPLVVLDDTVDGSAAIAASRGIRTITSTGGKVEAQRRGVRAGPFQLFGDADIVVEPDTILALCTAMLDDDRVWVAVPDKRPLPPLRDTPLARALHVYNAKRGFSSARAWFSGKLFAIRAWNAPDAADIARRALALPPSRFHDFAAPLSVDDIYLSRRVVHDHGKAALRETAGIVWFRAPETWLGMYRYYRRMRRELERIEQLFPELGAHERRAPDLLDAAPASERRAWHLFHVALAVCRLAYRVERAVGRASDPWPAIAETKQL
ncbi:MAG TPA: glycosyltransferase [Kofleriaceae bacterium]|nr:glycosyltransferase [Kofleriaceae bacterium]